MTSLVRRDPDIVVNNEELFFKKKGLPSDSTKKITDLENDLLAAMEEQLLREDFEIKQPTSNQQETEPLDNSKDKYSEDSCSLLHKLIEKGELEQIKAFVTKEWAKQNLSCVEPKNAFLC